MQFKRGVYRRAAEVDEVFGGVRIKFQRAIAFIYADAVDGHINSGGISNASIVCIDGERCSAVCRTSLHFKRAKVGGAGDQGCVGKCVGNGIHVLVVGHGVGYVRWRIYGVGWAY